MLPTRMSRRSEGDHARALRLFQEAAEAESQALESLDPTKLRKLGITTVSAVSLWFKARQFGQVALHFMAILKASSEDPVTQLPELVPAEDYRGTFLKLARNLSPTGKNFSQVEVRGADDVQGIVLVPENRKAINSVLRPKVDKKDTEDFVELRGVLRALHLEKDWLELLVAGEPVHVDGLSDAVDDVIGPMVNRPVIVQAKRTKKRLRFVDIELED